MGAKGDPLTTDTVMYGASVTKAVFAYTAMQLVDQGKIKLDMPIRPLRSPSRRYISPRRISFRPLAQPALCRPPYRTICAPKRASPG